MYTIRKAERYTIWEATKAVNLDPESFKMLTDMPYEGESEEEFAEYIQGLYEDDWYEIYEELDNLGFEDDADALAILFEGEMEEYSNSTSKFEDSWFDIGQEDPSYTKWGGFNVNYSTSN